MLGTIGFLACATTGRQPNARVILAMGSNLGLLASASAVDIHDKYSQGKTEISHNLQGLSHR